MLLFLFFEKINLKEDLLQMYQGVLLILWSFFLSKFKIPKFISAYSYIMHIICLFKILNV